VTLASVVLAVPVRADAATAVRDATASVLHGADGLHQAESCFHQSGSGFCHTESGFHSAVSDETAEAVRWNSELDTVSQCVQNPSTGNTALMPHRRYRVLGPTYCSSQWDRHNQQWKW